MGACWPNLQAKRKRRKKERRAECKMLVKLYGRKKKQINLFFQLPPYSPTQAKSKHSDLFS